MKIIVMEKYKPTQKTNERLDYLDEKARAFIRRCDRILYEKNCIDFAYEAAKRKITDDN